MVTIEIAPPTMSEGLASGTSTLRTICHGDAPMDCAASITPKGTVQYDEAMIRAMEEHATQDKNGKDRDDEEGGADDPMLKAAVEVVIDAGQASTSLLQRRCKLGYARAARIMDEMEQKGIIGPYEGAKPRAVLISRQQWLEMCMNQPDNP